MEQRERFIRDHRRELYTMAELCARYGISRKTGYNWLGRFEAAGRQGLPDRSRARGVDFRPRPMGEPVLQSGRTVVRLGGTLKRLEGLMARAWLAATLVVVGGAVVLVAGGGAPTHAETAKWAAEAVEQTPNALAMSGENVVSGQYLLYRPLYLTVPEKPSPVVAAFVKFAVSSEGQAIVRSTGTVTLAEGKGLREKFKEQVKRNTAAR